MRRACLIVCLFLNGAASLGVAADRWHHPLYLDGGGWWRQRVQVEISNDGDAALAGRPVELVVGEEGHQVALAGERAETVRVCDARGTEMLFGLFRPDGTALAAGSIPAGSRLVLPAECPARSAAVYYVYFDNPRAGCVPDFLTARAGLWNADVESGDGDTPVGWTHDEPDDQHRAMWSTETPQSGRRCLKTVVAAPAEATWIATRQRGIAIVGGAKYRMQAWVKAQDVQGFAGWYLHVGNAQQPMLLAPMLSAGHGTFDWKQVSQEFTAPSEANLADLGTVLRGTGTAWFDNVTLERLSGGTLRVEASRPERIELRERGANADWFSAAGNPGWDRHDRAAIGVLNLSDEPSGPTTVTADLGRLRARMRGRLRLDSLLVTLDREPQAHQVLGDQLLFAATLPPRSASYYHVYFADADPDAAGADSSGSRLVQEATNLVRNPSFEQGDRVPDGWTNTGPQQTPHFMTFGFDAPGRPDLGRRCAKMHVPPDAPQAWRGWHQNVPVRPGRTYLLSAWVKCQDVNQGEVRVHAHRRTGDGGLSKHDPFASIGPGISATTGWTLMSGRLTMPEDAVQLQVHLTMQHSGTVWHDAVAVMEVRAGTIVRLESRERRAGSGEQRAESREPVEMSAATAVWQVPAVIKVFPDDGPSAQTASPEISAARNECEPLQLAVRSAREIAQMRVSVEPPTGPQGFRLPESRVEVVGYVPIDYPSNYYQTDAPAWQRKIPSGAPRGDGWAGLWPDPLLPRDRFDLKANETQPIWITVGVPKNAPAGDYQGRVRLAAEGRTPLEIPFRVHVWDFTLSDENHVATIYDARTGGSPAWWDKRLEDLYPDLIRFMASRRLCPDTIRPTPRFRQENGTVTADFEAFDRAAAVYFDELKFPFAYTPWDLYLFGWGHPPKTVFGERPYAGDPPYEAADRSRLRAEYKRVYQAMLRLFWEHLKQKGWQERIVLYISDEPFDHQAHIVQQMKALCDMIHEVDPKIPIYCSTWKHIPAWDGYLDIWGIGHDGRVPRDKMADLRAAGDRLWFTTDGQMCTDTPYCAVERLLPHYCFKYGAQAYEFWGVAWLTYDPYRFGWHSYIHQSMEPGRSTWVRYPNGDGFLLYPGPPIGYAGIVSSIRFEQAREGVEDYEYFYLLRQRIDQAKAAGKNVASAELALKSALDLVQIPNVGGYYSTKILPDPQKLYAERAKVASAIESLAR